MEIRFSSRKMATLFNTGRELVRKYGPQQARRIQMRLNILKAADNLDQVPSTPPTRRHELSDNRKGQFAVDIEHHQRLTFQPNHSPLPRKPDGGIDLKKITVIKIIRVEDYH